MTLIIMIVMVMVKIKTKGGTPTLDLLMADR